MCNQSQNIQVDSVSPREESKSLHYPSQEMSNVVDLVQRLQSKIAQISLDVEKNVQTALNNSGKLKEIENINRNVDFPNSLKELVNSQLDSKYQDCMKRLSEIEKLEFV